MTQSARLNDKDLIEIATTKTPAHLLAISARSQIGTEVTDVLLQRGDRKVFHKLAGNAGAKFSEGGFATLVKHSERDGELAEKVGLRLDVPLRLFRELLLRATEAVRARLLALAGPESRDQIQRVLAAISEEAGHEAGFQEEHDYAEAQARVLAMRTSGELNEAAIFEFAKSGRHADMVASLSVLCGAPVKLVENLLQSEHREAILVPCKAAAFEWPTVRMILTCRSVGRKMSDQDLDAARTDYFKLSQNNAQRVLRFWQVRQTTSNNAATPPASFHRVAGIQKLRKMTGITQFWSRDDAPGIPKEHPSNRTQRRPNGRFGWLCLGKMHDTRSFWHGRTPRDQRTQSASERIHSATLARRKIAPKVRGSMAIRNSNRRPISSPAVRPSKNKKNSTIVSGDWNRFHYIYRVHR